MPGVERFSVNFETIIESTVTAEFGTITFEDFSLIPGPTQQAIEFTRAEVEFTQEICLLNECDQEESAMLRTTLKFEKFE